MTILATVAAFVGLLIAVWSWIKLRGPFDEQRDIYNSFFAYGVIVFGLAGFAWWLA